MPKINLRNRWLTSVLPRYAVFVERFVAIDHSPQQLANFEMGLVSEESIRKFVESANDAAGDNAIWPMAKAVTLTWRCGLSSLVELCGSPSGLTRVDAPAAIIT